MANCTQCGAELRSGIRFCTECGASAPAVPTQPQPPPQAASPPVRQAAPVYTAPASDAPPAGSKYELITAGGFIGISLLMCIPVVGIILTIVWACGGCRKLQKRNLARASLIMMAVALVISLVLGFAAKTLISSVAEETGITQNESRSETSGLFGSLDGEDSDETGQLKELQDILDQLESLSGEDLSGESSHE